MKTISLINLKGGVGKTTIATNLAYLLTESWGLRVLLIDNDKQGNASRWLEADDKHGTLANILMDGVDVKEVIQHSRDGGLDFIAADMGLIEANYDVIRKEGIRQDSILREAMAEIQDDYDICVVDNPPDINMSVFNVLALTDDVIIVTVLEADSIDGIRKMVQQVEDVKQFNPRLSIKGVLANQYIAYPDSIAFFEEIKKEGLPVFSSRISYATRPAKRGMVAASKNHQSLFEVCPKCRVSRDIMKFAEELLS